MHTEREAKRSALAWYVIYEEEFAEIRYVAEFGERPVHGTPATYLPPSQTKFRTHPPSIKQALTI